MNFSNLKIIGERINPGFKSSKLLFDSADFDGFARLAAEQQTRSASIINVNAGQQGLNDHNFLRQLVNTVQAAVDVPLSFDIPEIPGQRVCLETYDHAKNGKPLINSISELRWEMTDLLKDNPCKVLLMASERNENGEKVANRKPVEVFECARRMVTNLLSGNYGLAPNDIYIDVSVAPIAVDMEEMTKMAVESIGLIGSHPDFKGVHMSVGLSNISIMVPPKALDGSPLKILLESAFLTKTVPLGLDTIIGTAGRDYQVLPEDNFVMRGFTEALALSDIEAIMRIQALYQ